MTSVAIAQHEGHASEPVAHDQVSVDQPVHADTNAHAHADTLAHAAHDTTHAEEGFKIGKTVDSPQTVFSILRQFTHAKPVKSSIIGLLTDLA